MGRALRYLGRLVKRLLSPLAPAFAPLKDAAGGFMEHNVTRMAASIAYFGAFSLAPLLVIMISLASLVFGKSASEGLIVEQLSTVFGESNARFIQSMLAAIYESRGITLATVLAILLLLWASTRIVGAVRGSLNDIWGVCGRGGTGFGGYVVGKLVDMGMVLVFGFVFLATMLANTAISALTEYFSEVLPMPGWLFELTGFAFSLVVIIIFLTIIFRVLPNIKVRFSYVIPGASVTAVLFAIGNYVIGRYLGRTSPGSAFGAAGSLAVIMIWMYYSANIVLFGAEVTRAYARRAKGPKVASGLREPEEVLGDDREGEGPALARERSVAPVTEDAAGEQQMPDPSPLADVPQEQTAQGSEDVRDGEAPS